MKRRISLQTQLLKTTMLSSVVAGCLTIVLLAGVGIYQSMKVHDELMEELATLLLSQSGQQHQQIEELAEEFNIDYQLKQYSHRRSASESMFTPVQIDDGFHFIWHEQQWWRIYQEQDDELMVQTVQPVQIRFEKIGQLLSGYTGILLILWLLQCGLIYFALAKQFRVVHQLSAQISQKSIRDLEPITGGELEIKELMPMILQLNHLLKRLEHAVIAEQRFTADASHELRSPLSAIGMRMQVLKRKYQYIEGLAEQLQPIEQDIQRGTHILENLLLLARLDPTQSPELQLQTVDVNAVVTEVVQSLAPYINEKNILLNMNHTSCMIKAHPELLFSCLRNFIDNAVRYAPEQGQVWITTYTDRIIIEDNGQHITDEVLARLGERFYRALGTQQKGSGLGLSICKKIVQLHQWQLVFAISVYGGLKVTLTF